MKARWVEERCGSSERLLVTSSGVSAGGDAALTVIAHLSGKEKAKRVARAAEWIWTEDPRDDPFFVGGEATEAAGEMQANKSLKRPAAGAVPTFSAGVMSELSKVLAGKKGSRS